MKKILIDKVNKSNWWHVPPGDPSAYKKRGKFLVSTYMQAEFYGRPNLHPEKVRIKNPLFGFSEIEILKKLFGNNGVLFLERILNSKSDFYEERIGLDAKMYQKAKELGYDSIILMVESGKNFLRKNIKPHSIELNLLNI